MCYAGRVMVFTGCERGKEMVLCNAVSVMEFYRVREREGNGDMRCSFG